MAYKSGLHKKIFSIFDGVQLGNDVRGDDKTTSPSPAFDTTQAPHQQMQDLNLQPSHQDQQPVQKPHRNSADKKAKVASKSDGSAKANFTQLWKKIRNKILPSTSSRVSSRQKAAVVLVPALCIVLFVLLFKGLGASSPRKHRTTQTQVSTITGIKIPKINWKIPAPVSSDLRDPMQLGSKTSPYGGWSGSNFVLKGIVVSDEMTMAIIGDNVVHEGDMIGDIKVFKINKDSVELEKNGQKISLKVGQDKPFQENIKSP